MEYTAYETTQELIKGFKEHFNIVDSYMPPLYIQGKHTGTIYLIHTFRENAIGIENASYDLQELLDYFTYLDGGTIGKKQENGN